MGRIVTLASGQFGATESCEYVKKINFSAAAAAFDSALKRV
jgi:hypothetical protein